MTEKQTTEARPASQLTRPEKALLPVVIVVVVGWVMQIDKKDSSFEGPEAWSLMLSLGGVSVIGVLIGLKYFGRLVPPARIHRLALSIACLLPFAGILAAQLDGIGKTLTVWGSIAITYIGVTSLSRHCVPRFVHDPFRLGSASDNKPESPPQEPAPTGAAEAHDPTKATAPATDSGTPEAGKESPPDDGGRLK